MSLSLKPGRKFLPINQEYFSATTTGRKNIRATNKFTIALSATHTSTYHLKASAALMLAHQLLILIDLTGIAI